MTDESTDTDLGVCSRCKVEKAVTLSRKEAFCESCFIRFINGKQRKHMSNEKFKVKFGEMVTPVKVILPLSFGTSSLVLLDIIISLFNEQSLNKRAKIGLELIITHIDESGINKYESSPTEMIRKIREHYRLETTKYPISFKIIDIESFVSQKGSLQQIMLTNDYRAFESDSLRDKDSITVAKILENCTNRASRHDLIQIILKELIKTYAISTECETILWGHNMSTLAEEVISLTVKGRGGEIYQNLTDGVEKFQGAELENIHPLRDVSLGEIKKFVKFRDLEKLQIIPVLNPDKLMNKQKTMNEVVRNYYKTVDQENDNIVSTVVKTGAKLVEPKNFNKTTCIICHNRIYNSPMEWLSNITYNGKEGPQNEAEQSYLTEWELETKAKLQDLDTATRTPADVCYGCAVTINSTKGSSVSWPVQKECKTKEQVLNEFIIASDDEE